MSKKLHRLKCQGSPFECGVNVLEFREIPISIRFFMLMVVFLIFDVELILLVPFVLYLFSGVRAHIAVRFIVFLITLLLGVFVE
jgi:NADH:ubiquinone oxidoreductase subunit 3 (subunit A)